MESSDSVVWWLLAVKDALLINELLAGIQHQFIKLLIFQQLAENLCKSANY